MIYQCLQIHILTNNLLKELKAMLLIRRLKYTVMHIEQEDERDFIDAVHFYILKDKDKREYKGIY